MVFNGDDSFLTCELNEVIKSAIDSGILWSLNGGKFYFNVENYEFKEKEDSSDLFERDKLENVALSY